MTSQEVRKSQLLSKLSISRTTSSILVDMSASHSRSADAYSHAVKHSSFASNDLHDATMERIRAKTSIPESAFRRPFRIIFVHANRSASGGEVAGVVARFFWGQSSALRVIGRYGVRERGWELAGTRVFLRFSSFRASFVRSILDKLFQKRWWKLRAVIVVGLPSF